MYTDSNNKELSGMEDTKVYYLPDLESIEALTDCTKSTSSIPSCNIDKLPSELILHIIAWIKTLSRTYDPTVFPQATYPFLRDWRDTSLQDPSPGIEALEFPFKSSAVRYSNRMRASWVVDLCE